MYATPIDLRAALPDGALFTNIEDPGRVEAFIPAAGVENHAANLCALPNGDLLCVWFAGLMEGHVNTSIACSRLPAGAASWTAPVWLSTDETRSEQNPLLWQQPGGPLWLLYTAQETRGVERTVWEERVVAGQAQGGYFMQWTAQLRRRLSWDHGHTWGPVETFADRPGSFDRHPPLVTDRGTWLLPLYYSRQDAQGTHSGDSTVVWRSVDNGATWREIEMPGSRGRVHASLVQVGSGHVAAFLRSRAADRIYRSDSLDDGQSWSAPERTALANNNSSIQAVRTQSGELVIGYNDLSANEDPSATVWTARRFPLTLALSEDGGATWPYRRHVEMSDGFCGAANLGLNRRMAYPSVTQTSDGWLHVAFSYRSRQCIKHVRVAVDWIKHLWARQLACARHPRVVTRG